MPEQSMLSPSPLIRLQGVARDFHDGRQNRRVLHPTDLAFFANALTIISGPSGSGKTTLLTLMALILNPSEGRIFVKERDVTSASEGSKATLRLRHFGFVFQNAALIPALSVIENVLIAAVIQGGAATKAVVRRAEASLERLGLIDFAGMKVEKLSGGQKQRVAIARALINEPEIILCDEPTSALDVDSSAVVLKTLKDLCAENRAVVLVTHDPRVFPYADRLIQIEDGKVTTDTGS
jgi:putative ABC transport system ATP-binding protein